MKKLIFEYNGKIYEVYGKAQHIGGNYKPHIYDIETKKIPDNQMQVIKGYLFSKGIEKEEVEALTTYELIYMLKKYLLNK